MNFLPEKQTDFIFTVLAEEFGMIGSVSLLLLSLAFDFDWSNKSLFYGLYRRTNSYFDNSEMAAVMATDGPFKDFEMSEDEWYAFHLASWLHL